MTERPILFSAPMVRAILAGSKSQTRRVVKPSMRNCDEFVVMEYFQGNDSLWPMNSWDESEIGPDGCEHPIPCPYGAPGDRLWVRETWRPYCWREDGPITVQFNADGTRMADKYDGYNESHPGDYESWYERIAVEATEECERKGLPKDGDGCYHWPNRECPLRWRPSIFMPRWASRLTLEVTGVRVERVRDISEDDAIAEGVESGLDFTAVMNYAILWNKINGKSYPWSENPWVWVVSFKRVEAM